VLVQEGFCSAGHPPSPPFLGDLGDNKYVIQNEELGIFVCIVRAAAITLETKVSLTNVTLFQAQHKFERSDYDTLPHLKCI